MHFSLGQSSDRLAILRNLLEMHLSFPSKRPADAKEDQVLGLRCNPAESTRNASALPFEASCGR